MKFHSIRQVYHTSYSAKFDSICVVLSRVDNLYIEESILLSITSVETRGVKLWRNWLCDIFKATKMSLATKR